MANKLSESLLCSICHELMNDPVSIETGHSFCRDCIEQWLQDNNTCPMTNTVLTSKIVFPNHTLKIMINQRNKNEDDLMDTGVWKKRKLESLKQEIVEWENKTDSTIEKMKEEEEDLLVKQDRLKKQRKEIQERLRQNQTEIEDCERRLSEIQHDKQKKEETFKERKEYRTAQLLSSVDRLNSFELDDSYCAEQNAEKMLKNSLKSFLDSDGSLMLDDKKCNTEEKQNAIARVIATNVKIDGFSGKL